MSKPIDFVICWVDGNDPKWRKEKNNYDPKSGNDDREIRYRDWDNLQYWFRGVEKYTPWVNKIHFVTWGHIPYWLDTNHPKINIVKHEDYIPQEYLPTFSARPIEINLHRIEGLADQFVYFNDDMFITRPMSESDFFLDGKPRDIGVFDIGIKLDETHGSAVLNSIIIINKYFNKRRVIKSHPLKWFHPYYGFNMLKSVLLLPWGYITGFYTPHLPNSFLKSTFYEVWEQETEKLEMTSNNKFRDKEDVTQYIFKFWQLASGNFKPTKNLGKLYSIGRDFKQAKENIKKQKYKMICLNDSEIKGDFEKKKKGIIDSFQRILPEKSSFEL